IFRQIDRERCAGEQSRTAFETIEIRSPMRSSAGRSLQHQKHAFPKHQHLFLVVVFYEQAPWRLPTASFALHFDRPRVLRSDANRFPIDSELAQRLVAHRVLVLKRWSTTNVIS